MVATLFCLVLLPGLMVGCSREADVAAETESPWGYAPLPHEVARSFDLHFALAASSGARARLAFGDADSDTTAFIEFNEQGVFVRSDALTGPEPIPADPTPLSELEGVPLLYQRRPHRWSLLADGKLLVWGDAPPPTGVAIQFGAANGSVEPADVRFQQLPPVQFADGFMRLPDAPSEWQELSGTWTVSMLTNPLLSANAFRYAARGEPHAVAVAGESDWSDLAFSAAAAPAERGAVGLIVCYQGPKDYTLFRWSANDAESPGRQLIRVRGDERQTLAEAPGGYEPGQWYRLKALLGCGWLRVSVDDTPFFLVRDRELTSGRVGLYAEGAASTLFDDVEASSRAARFFVADPNYRGVWLRTGGEWLPVRPAHWDMAGRTGGFVVHARNRADLLWAGPEGDDFALGAELAPWEKGTLGLLFRYADLRNTYGVRWRKASTPRIQLFRTEDGRTDILAERAFPEDFGPHHLQVQCRDDDIRVMVDGREVMACADRRFDGRRAGMLADDVRPGKFSQIVYEDLPSRTPIETAVASFSAEKTMQIWSGEQSDWDHVAYGPTEGLGVGVNALWYKAEFLNDVGIEMRFAAPPTCEARREPKDGDQKSAEEPTPLPEAGLLLSRNGESIQGHVLRLRRVESGGLRLERLHAGEVVDSRATDWTIGPRVLSLRREQDRLICGFGDSTPFTLPLGDTDGACRVGWYALNGLVEAEDVDIYAEEFLNENFKSAPTLWRHAGGIWEVSNKWECDPRWSFFSGRSDRLAALWSKFPIEGDFTIEYYVGNKMDRERGSKYEYAQDMNLTVCADGEDLTSGYSFLFGGFGNTKSCIFRKSEEWAVNDRMVIDRQHLHRKWYHIKVSRRGNELRMEVDGRPVFSKTDDKPLGNGRFAIWTWNNGIMIGRVRVAAERIGACDPPDRIWPAATQSIYGN